MHPWLHYTNGSKSVATDPYINSDCDEISGATIFYQKATFWVLPEYLLNLLFFLRHPIVHVVKLSSYIYYP